MTDITNEFIEESNLERIKAENTLKAVEKELKRKDEALKSALFKNGMNAVSHFLGFDVDPSWDKDTIDNAMDQVIAQMPPDVYDDWCYFLHVV